MAGASLLHQPLLPTIEVIIAAMSQEEVRLSLEHADMKAVPTSTFTVTVRMEWGDPNKCHTCGKVGHWKRECPTRGRGRGYYRGGTDRGRHARGRGGYLGTSGAQLSRGRGGHLGNSRGQRAHMVIDRDTAKSKGKEVDEAAYGDFAHASIGGQRHLLLLMWMLQSGSLTLEHLSMLRERQTSQTVGLAPGLGGFGTWTMRCSRTWCMLRPWRTRRSKR